MGSGAGLDEVTSRRVCPAVRGTAGALLLAGAVTLTGCGGPEEGGAAEGPVVLVGGTLVDGTGASPVEDAVVVVRGGTIAAAGPRGEVSVPDGARRLETEGRWILPGYVDAHVHFSQSGWFDGRPDAADVRDRYPYPAVVHGLRSESGRFFRSYFCSGVTAAFDVGGYPWTRGLQERGREDPRALRVAATGALLSTVDFWLNLPDQRQFVFMASDSVVRRTVRSHAGLGSAAIKVWYITPSSWTAGDSARMSRRVQLAGSLADSVGLPLVVHATGLWEAKDALRAGAEVLVHSVFDDPVDRDFLTLARERGVIYTPTLTVVEGYRNAYLGKSAEEMPYPARCLDSSTRAKYRRGLPPEKRPAWARGPDPEPPPAEDLQQGLENLRRVHEAGITVALGTDAGNPGTAHGPSVHREMEWMARAGFSPMGVVVAATRNAARAMGLEDEIGTVEPGKRADLTVVGSNPLSDVRNARDVRLVLKDGRVVWASGEGVEGTGEAP